MKELPMSERPYEKLEMYGAEMLSNSELLAIIIKTGTKEETSITLAQKILNLKENLDKNDLRKTKIISQENWKVENLIISWNHILIFKWVWDIHWTYLCDESIAWMFKIMFSYIWEK